MAIYLNNLLAYKAKGEYDGKKPPTTSPWNLMKFRQCEDLNNPDNYWQEQAFVTDFATGIKRAVQSQKDKFSW
eukprot:11267921-Heterocapsa_arctica.AAC.1